jgi:hypothetical protein
MDYLKIIFSNVLTRFFLSSMSCYRQCHVAKKVATQNWLDQRNIEYESVLTKAELLEIAVKFAPPRRYKVNKIEKM